MGFFVHKFSCDNWQRDVCLLLGQIYNTHNGIHSFLGGQILQKQDDVEF